MADDDPDGYHIPLDYDIIKRWLADQDETYIKLVLRRLADMTDAEAIDFLKYAVPGAEYIDHNEYAVIWKSQGSRADTAFLFGPPAGFHYLLKQGFDIFGLIPAGLAIDAKTLK